MEMTVYDLIEILQGLPEDMLVYTEIAAWNGEPDAFPVCEIATVELEDGSIGAVIGSDKLPVKEQLYKLNAD